MDSGTLLSLGGHDSFNSSFLNLSETSANTFSPNDLSIDTTTEDPWAEMNALVALMLAQMFGQGPVDTNVSNRLAELSGPPQPTGWDAFFEEFSGIWSSPQMRANLLSMWIIYGIVFLFGVAGNFLTILTVLTKLTTNNSTNVYILGLAIADMLFLLIYIPYSVYYVTVTAWFLSIRIPCQIFGWGYTTLYLASIFILTVMSIDRYVVICRPKKIKMINTPARARAMLVTAWVFSGVMAIPVVFVQVIRSNTCSLLANEDRKGVWAYQTYIFLVGFIIPFIVMAICYGLISAELWRSMKRNKALKRSGNHSTKSSATESSTDDVKSSKLSEDSKTVDKKGNREVEKRFKVIKMMVGLVVVFFCCWGPKMIYEMLSELNIDPIITHYINYNGNHSRFARDAVTLISAFPSCLNPVMYLWLSSSFRHAFKETLGRCLPCMESRPQEKTTEISSSGFRAVSSDVSGTAFTNAPTDQ